MSTRKVSAEELARMLNMKMLVPNIDTFEKVIKIGKDSQIELDASAIRSIGAMMNSLASTTYEAHSKIQEAYNKAARESDEHSLGRLNSVWASIMNLPDISPRAKDIMAIKAQKNSHELQMKDRETNSTLAKIALTGVAGIAAIFATGYAVKTGRPPRMMESIFGKK